MKCCLITQSCGTSYKDRKTQLDRRDRELDQTSASFLRVIWGFPEWGGAFISTDNVSHRCSCWAGTVGEKWETSSDKGSRVMELWRRWLWVSGFQHVARSAVNQNPNLEFTGAISGFCLPLKAFRHNPRAAWQSAYVVFECNLFRFLQKQSQPAKVVGGVSTDNWQGLGGPGAPFTNNARPTRDGQPGQIWFNEVSSCYWMLFYSFVLAMPQGFYV